MGRKPASLLQIGRQFYFLSQNEDFGIFLLDLWAGAKCFKLLGGQFQYRGNMRTLDVVHWIALFVESALGEVLGGSPPSVGEWLQQSPIDLVVVVRG
jgi:hypothetical protein